MKTTEDLKLTVRRTIAATPERLFEAWTTPQQLLAWWGPKGVDCTHAEIDLRVGGRYRLGNRLPDGTTLYITGEFVEIDPPTGLTYTWSIEPDNERPERVSVSFEARGDSTEVVIVHSRIFDAVAQKRHEAGWLGCLEGLAVHVT